MTSIEQLQLCGIRSFDPNPVRRQTVTFHKPLTVILGKNGAGKTTIIEALLNACTGAMPPGSGTEKSAFVYDPKVLGESEVKAQIRLIFTGKGGKVMQVIRSFQATRSKNKLTFTTLDNTIAFQDTQTHKVISNTYRASDVDRVIPEMLGVSAAVLEHVIFCHQEDCNWPLAPPKDVKRIFDDIFAATRYVLALERLRENSKELKRQQKEHETTLMALREHREQAAQLEEEIAQKESAITEVRKQNECIEPELGELYEAAAQIDSAERDMESLIKEAILLEGRMDEKRLVIERVKEARAASTQLTNDNGDVNISNGSNTLFQHMTLSDLKKRQAELKTLITESEKELSQSSQTLNTNEERTRALEHEIHSITVTVRLLEQEVEQHVCNRNELRELMSSFKLHLARSNDNNNNNNGNNNNNSSVDIDYIVSNEKELTNALVHLQQVVGQERSEFTSMEQTNANRIREWDEKRQSLLRSIESKKQEGAMLEVLIRTAEEKQTHTRAELAELGSKHELEQSHHDARELLRHWIERVHAAEQVRKHGNGEHAQRLELLQELDRQNSLVASLRQRLAFYSAQERNQTEMTILQAQISEREERVMLELRDNIWPTLTALELVPDESVHRRDAVHVAFTVITEAMRRCAEDVASCQRERATLERNRALVEQRQGSYMQEKMQKEIEVHALLEQCRCVLEPLLSSSHAWHVSRETNVLTREQQEQEQSEQQQQESEKKGGEENSASDNSDHNNKENMKRECKVETNSYSTINPNNTSSNNNTNNYYEREAVPVARTSFMQKSNYPFESTSVDFTNVDEVLTIYNTLLSSIRHRLTNLHETSNNAEAKRTCYHEFVEAARKGNRCMVCNRPFNSEEERDNFIEVNSIIFAENNNNSSSNTNAANECVAESLHDTIHAGEQALASLESLQSAVTRLQQHRNALPQLSESISAIVHELTTIEDQERTVCDRCATLEESLHKFQALSQQICLLKAMSQEITSMQSQLSAVAQRLQSSRNESASSVSNMNNANFIISNNNNNNNDINTSDADSSKSIAKESEGNRKRGRDDSKNNDDVINDNDNNEDKKSHDERLNMPNNTDNNNNNRKSDQEQTMMSKLSSENGNNDVSTKDVTDMYEALNTTYNEATTRLHTLNLQLSELERLHTGSRDDIHVAQQEMHKAQTHVQELSYKLTKVNDLNTREERETEELQTLRQRLHDVLKEQTAMEQHELTRISSSLEEMRLSREQAEQDKRYTLRALENILQQIENAAPRVLNFLNSNRQAELQIAQESLQEQKKSLTEIKLEISKLVQTVMELRNRIKSLQKTAETLRGVVEETELKEALEADAARLAEVHDTMTKTKVNRIPNLQHVTKGVKEVESLAQLRDFVRNKISELERVKAQRDGNVEAMLQDLSNLKAQLAKDKYQNIEKRYRSVFLKVETTEIAVKDIDKYYVALEKAVQSYHQEKITQINQIIAELWRQTYRGSDIDTVEICSETEANSSTAARRSYNYRVIMRRGNSVIDMRGRCSAGQRVLACVIIRLALSEAFCCDCGILALDEPTTNLDEDNARSLAEALRALIESRRSIKHFQLVIITHDEQFVRALGGQTLDRFYYVHKDREGAFSVIDERTFDQLFA